MDTDSQIEALLGLVDQPTGKASSRPANAPSTDEQIEILLGHADSPTAIAAKSPLDFKPAAKWDGFRQALDAASFGALSAGRADEKAKWEKAHGPQASAATVVGTVAPALLLSTAAEQGIFRGGQLASKLVGSPIFEDAARFLTGLAQGSLPYRGLSRTVSGAGQGALSAEYARQFGQSDDVAGGGLVGAATNLATSPFGAPLRGHVVPEVAALARRWRDEGMPLTTAQIPGAPLAAKAYSKLLNMGKSDVPALTEGLLRSTGSNAKRLNAQTLADARGDIKDRLQQKFSGSNWNGLGDLEMPKAFDTALGAGLLKPDEEQAVRLAQNQWTNAAKLERIMKDSQSSEGLVDPSVVLRHVQSNTARYPMGLNASQAAAYAGNPTDIGTLAEGANAFVRQPSSAFAHGAALGLGGIGMGALEFAGPHLEHIVPYAGLAAPATAAYGAAGGLMNNPLYMNLLLRGGAGPLGNPLIPAAQQLYGNKAASGAGPLLAGSNPLIPGYLAARDNGAPAAPTDNWGKWLKAQSFLESPSGAPSEQSSAKGYFQFIDSTAKKATDAGLPNPQRGNYAQQADATRQYIQRFYPDAAEAIETGDYPTAVRHLRDEWPSLPGGSQQQNAGQYRLWNSILSGEDAARPRIEVHPEAQVPLQTGVMTVGGESNPLSGSQ